jgi:hypothetical protein
MTTENLSPQVAKGKGSSIFSLDSHARDNLRYGGKKLTDPINTAEVYIFGTKHRINGGYCRLSFKPKDW